MNKQQAWNAFYATGKVAAYLDYKNASTEDEYEVEHRRADFKKQSNGGTRPLGHHTDT